MLSCVLHFLLNRSGWRSSSSPIHMSTLSTQTIQICPSIASTTPLGVAWQDWHSWSYHYERPKQWIQEDKNLCYIGRDVDVTLGKILFEPTLCVKLTFSKCCRRSPFLSFDSFAFVDRGQILTKTGSQLWGIGWQVEWLMVYEAIAPRALPGSSGSCFWCFWNSFEVHQKWQ